MNRSAPDMQSDSAAGSPASDARAFRAIAELGGDAAIIIDSASRTLRYLSPAATRMLGYGAPDFAAALAGQANGGPLGTLCAGLRDASGRTARELDVVRPDGSTATVELITQALGGTLVGLVRDLSARGAAQAEQRRFASMLNHEFRTPLSIIDGAIQRLEATSAQADEATRQRYRKIGAAVDRLVGMLDEYLSPDRLAAIGKQKQANSVSPRALLDAAAKRLRDAGRAPAVFADGLPDALRADPAGLALAVNALVDNVLAHTPPEAPVELAGRCEGRGVALVVRDGGPGVPAADAGMIFDRGYRGGNAAGKPGSGLGLYMARSVVEVHGGVLELAPSPLLGAAFRIWLPSTGSAGEKVASGETSSDNRPTQAGGASPAAA